LELQNFGSVLRDCSNALSINARSPKAFYRSAMALLSLDRPEEAIDCCDRCLSFDQDNKGVQSVRQRAMEVKFAKEEKERVRLERVSREDEYKRVMKLAFRQRNLIPIAKPGSDNLYTPHFDPEDPETLVVPTFFLYPQHATSDFIPHLIEDTPFAAHLAAMFPPDSAAPEWDKKGEYVAGQLVLYATTHRKRVLKIGKKMSLRDVCKAVKGKDDKLVDGLELKDGCVSFVVLPKGNVEQKWVEEFKKTRDV